MSKMKNGEITVRFAAENELARVNELREQVSRLHAENGPDVFRPDFCNELRQIAKKRKLERLEPDVWSFNRDAVRFCEAAVFETYRQYMDVKTLTRIWFIRAAATGRRSISKMLFPIRISRSATSRFITIL